MWKTNETHETFSSFGVEWFSSNFSKRWSATIQPMCVCIRAYYHRKENRNRSKLHVWASATEYIHRDNLVGIKVSGFGYDLLFRFQSLPPYL